MSCRIFVSYSHQDANKDNLPRSKSLLDEFELCLTGSVLPFLADQGLAISGRDVFIDRQRLNSEPTWSDAIEQALASCDVLIFLVSPDSAHPDRFCMQSELQPAVRRGVPVIPILLRDTPNWIKLQVPGTKDRLGKFHSGGLPKHQSGDAFAITSWANRDEAWSAVGKDVASALQSVLSPVYGSLAAHGDKEDLRVRADLLPFFCDHDPHDKRFQAEASQWAGHPSGQALLTLVRGHYRDSPSKFAERLISHRLKVLARQRGIPLPESLDTRLPWPVATADDEPPTGKDFLAHILDAIDTQLGSKALMSGSEEAVAALLAHHLVATPHATVVFVLVSEEVRHKDFQQGLDALLACLSKVNCEDGSLAKLWLFIVDERAAGVRDRKVRLSMATDAVKLVQLDRMRLLRPGDVDLWHSTHGQRHRIDVWLKRGECRNLFWRKVMKSPHTWWRLIFSRRLLGLQEWADAVNERRPA